MAAWMPECGWHGHGNPNHPSIHTLGEHPMGGAIIPQGGHPHAKAQAWSHKIQCGLS